MGGKLYLEVDCNFATRGCVSALDDCFESTQRPQCCLPGGPRLQHTSTMIHCWSPSPTPYDCPPLQIWQVNEQTGERS